MIYAISQWLIRLGAKLLCNWRVIGRENAPTSAAIIASNHLSNFDPPLLGSMLSRRVYYFAKIELFRNPIVARILKAYHAFPVRRGEADKQAWKQSIIILKRGDQLIFFPEGTRSKTGELGRPQPGMARLAVSAGVPIIPAAILGSERIKDAIKRKAKLGIAIGQPIDPAKYIVAGTGKHDFDGLSQAVMTEIARLKSLLENV